MKKFGLQYWYLAIFLSIVIFTITHKAPSTGCLEEMVLIDFIRFSFNCDSPELTNRINYPSKFFTEFHNWKGRPIYFLYGLVVSNILLIPVVLLKPLILVNDTLGQGRIEHILGALHIYLAYFFLNILIVFSSCWCAIRISGLKFSSFAAACLAITIASLDIVEGGVFLLHTNIMNLVVAIGASFYCLMGAQAYLLNRFSLCVLGIIAGLGILIYPAFAILYPAFFCGILYWLITFSRNADFNCSISNLNIVIFSLLFVFPAVFWTFINEFIFQTSTYLTLDKGQFRWIFSSFELPNPIVHVYEKLIWYLFRVYEKTKLELFLALFGFSFIVVHTTILRKRLRITLKDLPIFAILISVLGVLSFNFLQGYYAPRMFYSIVALFYIGLMRLAIINNCEKPLSYILLCVSAIQFYDAFTTYTTTGD